MTRIRLRFVQAFIARGNVYYYFRKPGCGRIRLPGLPGSSEFMAAYQAALDAAPRIEIGAGRLGVGTAPGADGLQQFVGLRRSRDRRRSAIADG